MSSWYNLSVLPAICYSLWYGCGFFLLKLMWVLCKRLISRQLACSSWGSLCLCSLVVSMFVPLWTNPGKLSGCSIAWLYAFSRCWCRAVSCLSQKLGTASGPGDFQLLVFFNAVCNSSWVMSSQGWHSVSAYFNSSLFIHSAEWLCSLSFSKMLRQNVSVASFFGGFSTGTCSLPRFLKNFFLLLANIWFCLYCLLLFSYLLILWAFARIFILRNSLVVCRSWIVVTLYFLFIFCFFLEIFWVSLFCAMSVNIDRSALMPLIWFSILVFHFGCSWILLLLFGGFGVFYLTSQILHMQSHIVAGWCYWGSGVSSAIISWIAWFVCLINTSAFLFTVILGRGGLSVMLVFSHSALALLISLARSSITGGFCWCVLPHLHLFLQ